ncbi:MAG: CDP-alcohol phosphatidyltransferase family protein [Microbacteriaceae bacterium]
MKRFAALTPIGLAFVGGMGALLFATAGLVAIIVGMSVYAISAVVAIGHMRRHHPHDLVGYANAVTLLRLAIVSLLIIPLVGATGAPVLIVLVAVIALCLDGVDGYLARRQKLSSDFGARFDMEVDSAFGLVLALLAFVVGGATWFVIALGLPRYLFGIAGLALPWLNGPLPERYSRKVVCVVQLAVLIAVQSPWFGGMLGTALVLATAGALAWSFGLDIRVLWRARARA